MWNSKVEPYLADFGILYTIIRYHVSIHFISSVSYDIYYKQYSLLKKGGGTPIWLTFSPIWCLSDGWQWTFLLNGDKWDKLFNFACNITSFIIYLIFLFLLKFSNLCLLEWCYATLQVPTFLKIALFLGGWYLGCSSTTFWNISLLLISEYCKVISYLIFSHYI